MGGQIKRNYLPHIIVLVLILLFPLKVNAASLNVKHTTMATGTKKTIKLNNVKSKNVKWKSSNKKIATVNKNGVVKAFRKGKVKITATYKKRDYSCTITVVKLKLNKKTGSIYVGSKVRLKVNGKPKKVKVKWSSSDNSIAKVTGGVVTGVNSGTAKICASCAGKKLFCNITVKEKANTNANIGYGFEYGDLNNSKYVSNKAPEVKKYQYGINYNRWNKEEQAVIDKLLSLQTKYPEETFCSNLIYYKWNGGIYKGGYGCAGFAFRISDEIFSKGAYFVNDIRNLRPGDIVYGSAHSVVVLDTDRSSYIIALEGNVNHEVKWGYKYTFSDLNEYGMTRILSRW